MKSFLLGVGIGAAAGLLLAPKEGRKTRTEWGERARNWFEQLQDRQTGSPETDGSEEFQEEQQQMPQSEAVAEVLHTAKRDDLRSVPGIGRATAKRIIKNRPYQSGEEVLEEGVLPEKTLEKVKEELVEKDQDIA